MRKPPNQIDDDAAPAVAKKPRAAAPSTPPSTTPPSTTPASTTPTSTSSTLSTKKPGRSLPVLASTPPADPLAGVPLEETALSAKWPEPVLVLSDDDRKSRVRAGLDSVLFDDVKADGSRVTRGFIRAVLRVPLDAPKGRVYGVFVEVDRAGYVALQQAFKDKVPTRITARLATRLPFLDDAYGSSVVVEEDGSDRRARVVDVDSASLRQGPTVGPRAPRVAAAAKTGAKKTRS